MNHVGHTAFLHIRIWLIFFYPNPVKLYVTGFGTEAFKTLPKAVLDSLLSHVFFKKFEIGLENFSCPLNCKNIKIYTVQEAEEPG